MGRRDNVLNGCVWHYGATINAMKRFSQKLRGDIKSGDINDPDFSEETIQLMNGFNRGENNSPENLDGIGGNSGFNSLEMHSSLIYGRASVESLRASPHPLAGTYLQDIDLPIHLRRGLTFLRSLVRPIGKLYASKNYWEGIPRDEDTAIFYEVADVFQRGVKSPLSNMELDLSTEGFDRGNTEVLVAKLTLINSASSYIELLGAEIYNLIGIESGQSKKWSLCDFDPEFIP